MLKGILFLQDNTLDHGGHKTLDILKNLLFECIDYPPDLALIISSFQICKSVWREEIFKWKILIQEGIEAEHYFNEQTLDYFSFLRMLCVEM